jgi:hypothetical protein
MIKNNNNGKKDLKQRLTAFIDPVLVKRAKIRGTLEGLTISEIVENALDAYTPQIEKNSDQRIKINFSNYHAINSLIPETNPKSSVTVPKHSKSLTVPR